MRSCVQLIPLALSIYPRIVCTPHFPVGTSLFWLLWVFSSHNFSTAGLSLLFASQFSPAFENLLQWYLFMGGSVQHRNQAEWEGSGFSQAPGLR